MELAGIDAPPMVNGEAVFEAPWQSRAFGMARVLCARHHYEWDEFRLRLMEEIGTADPNAEYHYYDHFLAALIRLLDEKRICVKDDVRGREETFAERKSGHDHVH